MKTISLWQPWASAIPAGLKTIETRSWATSYRGPLAIHAAKRWTREEAEFWYDRVARPEQALSREGFRSIGILNENQLPLGCIVATCEIYDCLSTDGEPSSTHKYAEFEGDWGNYSPGRFAWLLRNVTPLSVPVPCVGRQGFFAWTPESVAAPIPVNV